MGSQQQVSHGQLEVRHVGQLLPGFGDNQPSWPVREMFLDLVVEFIHIGDGEHLDGYIRRTRLVQELPPPWSHTSRSIRFHIKGANRLSAILSPKFYSFKPELSDQNAYPSQAGSRQDAKR